MKLKIGLFLVSATVLLEGAFASTPWFDVRFVDYADGETLSDKGVHGGSWESAGGAGVSAVAAWERHDGENDIAAMDLHAGALTNGIRFAATNVTERSVWRTDFDMKFTMPIYASDCTPDGPVAFTILENDAGDVVFGGWVDDAWHELSAAGIAADTNVWYHVRLAQERLGDEDYVSFSLVNAKGEAVRLCDANGAQLFAAGGAAAAVSNVAFNGDGRFSGFSGLRDQAADKSFLHWIGGAAGDWDSTNNWSLAAGGAPTDRVPGAGDAVKIPGTVALTRGTGEGKETATVTDFLSNVGEDGQLELLSGGVVTPVTLDTTRLQPGKKIEVKAVPFGGLKSAVTATWAKGSVNGRGDKSGLSQVAQGVSYTPTEKDYESWFRCTYAAVGGEPTSKDFFFSRLPVVYLATDAGTDPTADKADFDGTAKVQGNADFKIGGGFDDEGAMPMSIHVRGNTTASQNKKPWKMKLDSKSKMFEAADKKSKEFDIGKSKHWVFLANAMDQSGYRNKLAYDFANEIGSFGMKSTFVTVVMNGTYRGVYQLCEHVRIDENRVNVYDWEGAGEDVADVVAAAEGLSKADKKELEALMSSNFVWVTSGKFTYKDKTYALGDYESEDFDFVSITNDITGGYLFALDSKNGDAPTKVNTSATGKLSALPIQVDGPETLFTNSKMKNWCHDYLQTFFDASVALDGYKNGKHFSEYADIDSLVSYYLVMELTGNYDAKANSRYAYKERGEKLKFGPVWDCDLAFASSGNSWDANAKNPERWAILNSGTAFYKEWTDDPYYCTLVRERYWNTARAAYANMLDKIANWDTDLEKPFAANATRWGNASKMESERKVLVDYITRRLAWVDQQFATVESTMVSFRNIADTTHPYDKAAGEAALPISFPNAPEGVVRSGRALKFRIAADAAIPAGATATVYVNGLKTDAQFTASSAGLTARIPTNWLKPQGEGQNCIEVIVRAKSGSTETVTRNFGLMWLDPNPEGMILLVR